MLGLATTYQYKSSEIRIWLRHTFGLLFLEPISFLLLFENCIANNPIDDIINQYSDYLVDNYMIDNCSYSSIF